MLHGRATRRSRCCSALLASATRSADHAARRSLPLPFYRAALFSVGQAASRPLRWPGQPKRDSGVQRTPRRRRCPLGASRRGSSATSAWMLTQARWATHGDAVRVCSLSGAEAFGTVGAAITDVGAGGSLKPSDGTATVGGITQPAPPAASPAGICERATASSPVVKAWWPAAIIGDGAGAGAAIGGVVGDPLIG